VQREVLVHRGHKERQADLDLKEHKDQLDLRD
jgi:hypothetical protein